MVVEYSVFQRIAIRGFDTAGDFGIKWWKFLTEYSLLFPAYYFCNCDARMHRCMTAMAECICLILIQHGYDPGP